MFEVCLPSSEMLLYIFVPSIEWNQIAGEREEMKVPAEK